MGCCWMIPLSSFRDPQAQSRRRKIKERARLQGKRPLSHVHQMDWPPFWLKRFQQQDKLS